MGYRDSAAALGRRLWTWRPEAEKQPGAKPQQDKYLQPEDHWLGRLIGGADTILRSCHGVQEFTPKRTCLFRIALTHAAHEKVLGCGRIIPCGAAVVELHLWNEHFPRIPRKGPDLAWAKLMRRRFRDSLCDLAIHLENDHAFDEIAAICACGAIAREGNGGKLARICETFGFEVFDRPGRSAAGRLVEFFCDIWIFLLVCAFNPRSLRANLLFRPRYELWMSREVLRQRFGRFGAPSDQPGSDLRPAADHLVLRIPSGSS